ncbi:uracil-DNA glycosylase [Aliiroseovarius sp. F47248L]|uniref:uracil-DNA glycosylase n=1 Tax=Aliiroseovarius sp. F47248L TaxID=2926420 RepID=UPI001FF1735E|nr:uracil-DNA glycosylase [Aliiroseovarius sp. F47248L]MCK0139743.1 uracil-DNA glycosylase [Aliiroseovarius sp. F47248L]
MESAQDWHSAKALLEWQIELGAVDAIGDVPVDRYTLEQNLAKHTKASSTEPTPVRPTTPPAVPQHDHVAFAKQAAAAAADLEALRAAIDAFEGCELKRGARNTVFADGNPAARVMVIGEAPGRDEDIAGKPFIGRAGQLLDKMFAAIGMGRDTPLSKDAIYITNVMAWRPPSNRDPSADEIAMMTPFLERHVQLVAPDLLVLMGNTPCQTVLGRKGIMKMRGNWDEAWGKPIMPMTHPAYLLRNPAAKREAWADLLAIQAKLRDLA